MLCKFILICSKTFTKKEISVMGLSSIPQIGSEIWLDEDNGYVVKNIIFDLRNPSKPLCHIEIK